MGTCCMITKYDWCKQLGGPTYKDDDGKEYCTLHAPIKLRERLGLDDEFNTYKNKHYQCNRDYSGIEFSSKAPFTKTGNPYKQKTILRDCKFRHSVDLSNDDFVDLDCSGSEFDDVVFDRSTFRGSSTSFAGVVFRGKATFRECNFLTKSNFHQIEYNALDFERATFSGDCIFASASGLSDAKDIAATNYVKLNFSHVIIAADHRIIFHKSSLKNCMFSPRGNGGLEFAASSLKNVSFISADLSNCVFNHIDLTEVFFLGAKLLNARFIDCKFNEAKFLSATRIILFDELFNSRAGNYWSEGYNCGFNAASEMNTNNQSLKETYCSFKNNFETNKDYVTADKFHYCEMEMKRFLTGATLAEKIDKKNPKLSFYALMYWMKTDVFSFYAWYKYTSGYGISYIRPLVLILISLLVFSSITMFTGLPNIQYEFGIPNDLGGILHDFYESLFYAIGNLIPGIARYFTEIKSSSTIKIYILQFIVMSTLIPLFILALRRHFKR